MDLNELNERLQQLNEALSGVVPFRLALLAPDDLEILKSGRNARFMRNDTFAQLVANVKRDGGLSSVPLVYAGSGVEKPRVLSGNHRVMAAKEAGLESVLCLVIDDAKTMQEQVAIQLSHNAIAGQDDLPTLKQLYDEIEDLALKAYSGIDEQLRKQLDSIKFSAISEPRLQFRQVTFLFLPREAEEIQRLAGQVEKILEDDESFLFQMRDYEEFFNAVAAVKQKLRIHNSATALMELLRRGMATLEPAEDQQATS